MCSDERQDSPFLLTQNYPCTVRQGRVNRSMQMNIRITTGKKVHFRAHWGGQEGFLEKVTSKARPKR